MENKYYELRLQINPDMEDLLSEIFFDNFDCEGIVLAEETYKDLEMVSTTEGTLRIFLRNDYEDIEDLRYDIENVLDLTREEFLSRGLTEEELGSWEFTLEEKENEDWSKKWKESWDVTHVTDKIAVVPDWIDYTPKDGEVIIKLEPGCAFGTGTHQTTQLCMKALEKYMNSDCSEFIALYGRRRVGKTFLVKEALRNQLTIHFTGRESAPLTQQLLNFHYALVDAGGNFPIPTNWTEAFRYLSKFLEKKKE